MEEETFYPGTVQEAHQAGRELVSKEAASGKPQGGKAPTECGARYEADQAKLLRNRENEHGRLLLLFWHCGNQDLKQWLDDLGYGAGQNFWIGANDLAKPGLFRWGLTANEVTFSKWARGEPNFMTVRGETEHCVELNPNTMEWNDSGCSKRLHFICETFSN
ncbi:galactose-specific C-type lectin [Culex quinquefasciatus]|uniref:Galactose-specific C-type lectin n=1 Tax=Culex quinquefasciatus TaxID=7176 RepID=B0W079_CULQU|nr:galactose-specific C-type lectin [Culex quinquefasciatus]|eukprot:XP_001842113.1 galactose-specific C-type lectin [Culex quinquefasciatus]